MIITSELTFKVLNITLKREGVPIIAVKNEFLGGNIGCAGLLTVRDIIKTIKKK
ncbi:MAG TPA: DUF512 domain-containing protein, partial [Candidatus Eremiobacteraeota bacterium]|nr:DUF512 domain-containing protein [Candidatus Eremiobacteraeota bacterium]